VLTLAFFVATVLEVDRAAIARLPELGRIESKAGTVLVLRGELTPKRKALLVGWAQHLVADLGRRFLTESAVKREVDACLFERFADYQTFADTVMGERPSDLGFYASDSRVVVVNLAGGGARNMAHELTHALVGDDWPEIPSWLTEGLGSLYGGADVDARGSRYFVNYRHRDVLTALKAGTLPDVNALLRAQPEEVYGERAMMWYGLARDFLLWHECRGELSAFYAAMKAGRPPAVDDAAFRTFAARIKKGDAVQGFGCATNQSSTSAPQSKPLGGLQR